VFGFPEREKRKGGKGASRRYYGIELEEKVKRKSSDQLERDWTLKRKN